VPVFLFQEGGSSKVNVFGEIARLTKGAHYHFAPGADGELADLLRGRRRLCSWRPTGPAGEPERWRDEALAAPQIEPSENARSRVGKVGCLPGAGAWVSCCYPNPFQPVCDFS
jgi:hypothetical protein